MRRVPIAVVIAGLAIFTLRATTAPQVPDGSYYFDGELVTLDPSGTEVVARFIGGTNAVSRFTSQAPGLQVAAEAGLPDRRFSVLGTPPPVRLKGPEPAGPGQTVSEAARLLDSLRGNPEVDFVAPVFHYPGTGVRVLPTDELIVRLRPGETAQDLAGVAAGYGLAVERPLDGTADQFVLRMIDGKGAHALAVSRTLHESGRFLWAEPNLIVEYQRSDVPNDPLFSSQWHLQNTGQSGSTPGADAKLVPAWDIETGSSAIVVAVIDDGMDLAHEDLAPNLFTNAGEIPNNGLDDDGNGYVDDVHGWDFSNLDNNVSPTQAADAHGTAVAGVAAARGNNGIGVTGACRTCRILPIKIFEGGFATFTDRIANAITYAATFADVINNSWGGGPPQAAIQTAIANANTNGRGGKGALVLFATGNSASGLTLNGLAAPGGVEFSPGTYGFQFEYSKDGITNMGFDTSWLAWVILPGGELVTFEGGLPAGWTTGGAAGWSVITDPTRTDEGYCLTKAAKAGTITHNQVSTLQVTNKAVGQGFLYLYHWTSSENAFDGLRVRIDADNNGTFELSGPLYSGTPFHDPGISFPAAHPESIAVGASTNFDCRSRYSQFGPNLAFVAPSNGGPLNLGITTTDRTGAPGYSATNYTNSFGGTSSATPLAAGIAALVLSRNPTLTRADAITILKNSADKVGPEPYVSGRNDRYGHGRLNAFQALQNTPTGEPAAFSKTAPASGATGQAQNPTLTWASAPGATGYEYCLDTSHNSACNTSWVSTGTATSVVVTGLAGNTTYSWQVRASNGQGTTYANGAATTFWSFTTAPALGTVTLAPTALNFAGVNTAGTLSPLTGPQTVTVLATPSGIAWTASADQPWVQITGGAGTGSGTFTVAIVNPGNILNGVTQAAAVITVSAPSASNAPRTLPVSLTLKTSGQLQAPFGAFDTPVHHATVQGSVAVTGWALDDVGIDRVEIWRDHLGPEDPAPPFHMPGHPAHGKVFIANGLFVAGTRPDVAAAYPALPFHNRGGWGYMLLTWGFPNANGTFVLTAVAWDTEGRHTILGVKTITVTNATATKPFGTIDVPTYGGTFSGHQWTFGWALTPSPGCTMAGGQLYMTMNSAPPNSPVTYGANRADIAAAFPGFADSQGAGGAVALNSTQYPDGIHQIGWLAYDSCGNGEGLGSRFFTILNGAAPAGPQPLAQTHTVTGSSPVVDVAGPSFARVGQPVDALAVGESGAPLWVARGMGQPATLLDRAATVWLSQTGRVELHATRPGDAPAPETTYEAYVAVNGTLQPLPVGSSFDAAHGRFYWQPVAGFLGAFPIQIARVRAGVVEAQWTTTVIVSPGVDETYLQIDATTPVLAGWALDPAATAGSGIGAVHVWARRPATAGAPASDAVFVGQAALGLFRPDVAAGYGAQFAHAGYQLPLTTLAPGPWEVLVYAWNERTGRWEAARVTTVRIGG